MDLLEHLGLTATYFVLVASFQFVGLVLVYYFEITKSSWSKKSLIKV
jgi:hypothetical protein